MSTIVNDRLFDEIKSLSDDTKEAILNYVLFIKYKDEIMEDIKIPNAITEQTFKDTDNGINLIHCKDTNDMFSKLGI